MDLTWTATEELARTSDDSAVRQRFEERNRIWLVVLLFFFGVFAILLAAENLATRNAHRHSVVQLGMVTVNLAVVAATMFAVWAPSTRDWTRQRMSMTSIGFIMAQYAFVLVYSRVWTGWPTALPWLMLGFLMTTTELVLLHGFLVSGAVIMSLVAPPPNHPERAVGVVVAVNIMTFALNLHFSGRTRKKVAGEMAERRNHAREELRMRDELRYARELQLRFLPEHAPSLSWAEISSRSIPATEVGGDYYDYFVHGNRVALVCGDVAGHGMAAGLVLSSLRTGFTLLRDSLHDPAAVLRRLHDVVLETSRQRLLVTVSVVVIDHDAGTARIASAGHPPVLLRRAGGVVESMNLYGPPLGVRLPVEIPQRTIDVTSGDTFILHSDGIYETRDPGGEDYGLERLEEVVRARGGGSAEELRDAILQDVAAFRGSDDAVDDVTVVICHVL